MAVAVDIEGLRRQVASARAAAYRGDAATALTRYRRIMRKLLTVTEDDRDILGVRVRTALGLAMAEWEVTGDLAAALELVADTEQVIEAADVEGRDLLAMTRGQRGLMLLRSGDVDGAVKALDRAAELIDYADPFDQEAILLNRGVLHLERHDINRARDDFERCSSIAEQKGDQAWLYKARHNLGYTEFLAGRIPLALAVLAEAEQVNPGVAHPVGLLDHARVLREAGLVSDADPLLAAATDLSSRSRLFQDLAEIELVRAECALVDGDPKRAKAFASSAHRRFVRRGNLRWQRKAELLVLRCERKVADGKHGAAQRSALRKIADLAAELADACRAEGRTDLARAAQLLAGEAVLRSDGDAMDVPTATSTDTLEIRLHTHEVRALAAMQRGDHKRAQAEVRKGLRELGSYQNRFGSLDLRTASAVHGGALAKLQLELVMADGRPSTVFAGIERARAVSTRLPLVRPPSDERTADLLAALRQVEEEARGLAGEPGAADALARLRSRAAQLQREIRARAWELEGDSSGSLQASARLGQVRDAAGEAAFVSYARHSGRWVAVVVAGKRSELLELASVAKVDALVRRVRADLDAVAMPRLPEPIQAAIQSSITSTLEQLDQLLVQPLRVSGRPLVVSASGMLVVLPWSLLPSRFGISTVVTPSATGWLRSQGGSLGPTPKVVAIGGPDLHLAAEEAKRVGDVWTSPSVLTGEQATVAAASEAFQSADVVHIAAHGTHRQDSPLFSSIRLADGQLYAYELDAEAHIAPFVALSACEAGLATVRPGDEGLGLTNVLLQLGSKSILAGVARVRDDGAAEVMVRVHNYLASGMDSAGALAAAQADCVDIGVPVPFICFGSSLRSAAL